VGGFTVLKELRARLPEEDIIYCADSANCPYGNRTEADLVSLVERMLTFLEEKQVKLVLIACNTTSALVDRYRDGFSYPILDIISPMARGVSDLQLPAVGLVATRFTVEAGRYEAELLRHRARMQVYSQGSRDLAMLVDSGDLKSEAIYDEVKDLMEKLSVHPVEHVILGCTHYPLVGDVFREAAPHIRFLNPAVYQAAEAVRLLGDPVQSETKLGTCTVYTSGQAKVCEELLTQLGFDAFEVRQVERY